MTWSPLRKEVTPGPTSTTIPAPSWPSIAGNKPSGSAPDRVNSSVGQTPLALISTRTSPALGPSKSTVTISKGLRAATATAAWVFIDISFLLLGNRDIYWIGRYPKTTGADLEAVHEH